MNAPAKKREALGRRRPIILTILCAIGFVGFPFTVMQLTDPSIKQEIIDNFGERHYKMNILSAFCFLFSYVGLWMMKRWGVFLCLLFTGITIAYYLSIDMPTMLIRCGQPLVISFMGIAFFKEMDWI